MEGIIAVAAWIASPLMALSALGCLLFCRKAPRKNLLWASGIVAGAALALLGGGWLLGQFGLAWRDLPGGIFAAIMIIGWLAVNLLTLGCFLPLELPDLAPVLRWGMKLTVVACACLSIYVTLSFGALIAVFSFDNQERVLSYQGQTLIETDEGFLDPEYHYYTYHGLLVRGRESLYGVQMEHLPEDS